MKYSILLIVVLMLGCAYTPEIPRITVSYDKFKNQATIRTSPSITIYSELDDLITLSTYAGYLCEGDTSCKVKYIDLNFRSFSCYGWQYLSSHDLILIVDNERIKFGEATRVGSVLEGSMTLELMFVIVPIETFRKIANAMLVEGKLGTTVFSMAYKDRELFRMLLMRIDKVS